MEVESGFATTILKLRAWDRHKYNKSASIGKA
jgi:hypothetical protein